MPFVPRWFSSPEVGLLFGPVSIGPPFAKSQKTGDLSVLGQVVRTQRCGYFWSRRSRQKVVRCLHFKHIQMRRSCHLRRGVFQAPEVGLLFGPVSLGPPFAKSQKTGALGVFVRIYKRRLWAMFNCLIYFVDLFFCLPDKENLPVPDQHTTSSFPL